MNIPLSAYRSAEQYLVKLNPEQYISGARNKASELKSSSREASSRLSERAYDSADSVVKAAKLFREFNEVLYNVREDIRDSKSQLKNLEVLLNEVEEKARQATLPIDLPSLQIDISASPKSKQITIRELLEKKRLAAELSIASASSSSSDWVNCLTRSSEFLFNSLEDSLKFSIEKGYHQIFSHWSTSLVKWFIEHHFLPVIFTLNILPSNRIKPQELSEKQWRRLAEALTITPKVLKHFSYLFVKEFEPTLHSLVSGLLEYAKQRSPDFNIASVLHPFRIALFRLFPILVSNAEIAASISSLIAIRCSNFITEIPKDEVELVHQVRNEMNKLLEMTNVTIL